MDIAIIRMSLNLDANRLGVETVFSTLNNKLPFKKISKGHKIHFRQEILCPSFDELGDTDPLMKNKDAILRCDSKLADEVNKSLSQGYSPLIIGGDHSLSWIYFWCSKKIPRLRLCLC